MTIEQDFYEELKQRAYAEHLPVATYARKLIMDNMPKNNSKTDNHERRWNSRTQIKSKDYEIPN